MQRISLAAALIIFQVGLVLLAKDWVTTRLNENERWKRTFAWVNSNSLPLYLLHTTGMAIAIALTFLATGYLPPGEPNGEWWLTRPLWFVAPAAATYPFLLLYKGATRKREDKGATVDLTD